MGRIAIITGAASGIGRALARALVLRGDTVVVADIDGDGAERVAGGLARQGPGAVTSAALDVRDAAAVAALVRSTYDSHGRLDLMVNNAGIAIGGEACELLLAHWDRAIDVNLRGVVHGVQAVYPLMVRQRSGHIVNTASLAGLLPAPGATAYAMTKHAVVGLSLSLRGEAAAYGVRVTAVCPGVVETPILDKGGPDDLPSHRPPGIRESSSSTCRPASTRRIGWRKISSGELTATLRWSWRLRRRGWRGASGATHRWWLTG